MIVFAIVSAATLVLFVVFNFVVFKRKYQSQVARFAEDFDIDPALVYAIIKVESNFKKDAVSSAGAIGLMQIIPSTAKWIAGELGENFDKENLFDPETNIKYGCFYLNYLYSKFEKMSAVLCAYNAGESVAIFWVDESGEIDEDKITYPETKNYLKKVQSYYKVYKNSQICK